MRQSQLSQRGEIIRHLLCRVIFSPSPAQTLNLVQSIVCNDALLAVPALNLAHLLGVCAWHYTCSKAS